MGASPLDLCIEAPEAIRPALLYAAEELLRPLALVPRLVSRETLGASGLYVGPEPEQVASGAVRIRQRPETVEALLRERPVAAGEVSSLRWSGGEAALPFPLGGAPAADPTGIVDADVLASVFWWLSGAQERATRTRDRWGRVRYADSLQAALGQPLATPVDAMRQWLGDALRQRDVTVCEPRWNGKPWAVALTHDLDATRTRRWRALAAGLARGRLGQAARRALGPDVRRQSARALADLARRHGIRSTFFAKAGASGPEDVRAEPERDGPWLRSLIAEGFEVGLHPSIQAATDAARLARERQRLARATGSEPLAVRSHYLRWDAAVTPALYAASGFHLDSTLGWAERPGFRRGTAHPFRLWRGGAGDGPPGDLWEAPLALMDTSLFAHMGLSPEAAAGEIEDTLAAVRAAGGLAVLLWHNAMDDDGTWARHLDVLDHALGQTLGAGGAVLPLTDALESARSRTV